MHSRLQTPTMESSDNACFHCGEPIPAGVTLTISRDGEEKPVCCAGCQAVADLIFSSGLGRYYQFRQELGRKAEEDLQENLKGLKSLQCLSMTFGHVDDKTVDP